jgi:hypothetical protein
MWKAKPKSRVSRLKASLKSVQKRGAALDARQWAELAAAVATAATALAAVAAALKKAKRSSA